MRARIFSTPVPGQKTMILTGEDDADGPTAGWEVFGCKQVTGHRAWERIFYRKLATGRVGRGEDHRGVGVAAA